jgi:hypothetical protein
MPLLISAGAGGSSMQLVCRPCPGFQPLLLYGAVTESLVLGAQFLAPSLSVQQ